MIDLHGQISMGFLKKRGFTGSYKGMRYLLQKKQWSGRNRLTLKRRKKKKNMGRSSRFMRKGFGKRWHG